MNTSDQKKSKPRGADPTKTRQKIIKAARQLFVKHGLNGTSMRAIAKQAGVTQSLLHHHFGNKESLWQKVKAGLLDQYFDEIERKRQQFPEENTRQAFDELVENRFRFMQHNPDIVRMALWQRLDNYPKHSISKGQELLRRLIENFDQMQKLGSIRDDISPAIVTSIIFVLTAGWFQRDYHWILDLDPTAPHETEAAADAYLEAIQTVLCEGLLVKDSEK